ncbi:SDR family NAD(P)-dependent oxidoreductase [Cryptosporangium aurantiacum]|uniref:Short-chain dehydrogenase n=1 Tax=Cryptosporangium aurantiacum TaxID=134849 RepID=A0A1M7RB19_9ACTN|nr:SDR family NAD(P)-dependent oxidoreductase [Cryptosporangium aurantiacum]SHN43406.1 Short-chain dehydrogenase [Cryptosporangium aurantiacum]
MSDVTGKVAVVTGAGSGIGRALALELARRGARLAISDIDAAGLAATADEVTALGAPVHADRLDVSDRDAFRAYAAAVAGHYGVVHQLYNNAGIADSAPSILETGYGAFERVLGVNLWGVLHGTKEFLPHLIASGDGHVVTISSLNGYMAQAGLAPYCTSKFAVRGFTETLRSEMLRDGHPVRVTVVHPGGVATNIAVAALTAAKARGETVTAEQETRTRTYSEKLLRMDPRRAATIILDGVRAGRPRILVGNDAKAIDALVRLVPRQYPKLVTWWSKRMFPEP